MWERSAGCGGPAHKNVNINLNFYAYIYVQREIYTESMLMISAPHLDAP